MNEGMQNLKEIEDLHKEIEYLKKEITIAREDGLINVMEKDRRIEDLTKINEEHKKINGNLRTLNDQLLKDLVKLQKQYDLETGKIVDKMRKEGKI
jgi:uncharacterized protein (DUF3084 family)|tara:strand:- start:246 stop:533 length:288 start_codon:yes stop_codon:yes gene_type:complete